MTDWVLIPCLRGLFAEFDRIAPSRDHASDGSIGDAAHREEVSDHNPDETGNVPIHDADHVNEVHAIDVDNTLNESDLTMEKVVQFLLARCRSGAERRLRYIIYNRRIWSASSGWVEKTYTGASPHTEHAHFSGSYETAMEASTASWHLEDIPVALTAADKTWLSAELKKQVEAVYLDRKPNNPLFNCLAGDAILSHEIPDGTKVDNPQTAAWIVIENIGEEVMKAQRMIQQLLLENGSGSGVYAS